MRSRLHRIAACSLALAFGIPAHAAPRASFWTTPEPGAPSAAVRTTAARTLSERGLSLEDIAVAELAAASLGRKLAAAIASYEALHLDDAAQAFAALATELAAQGGGDLDRRALSDAFLDAGLTLLELGRTDRAWDSFVAAARIDPTRTIDPAHVTPRGATAFHRAVAELTQASRVELDVDAPPSATLRLDGETQPSLKVSVLPGAHFAQVSMPGFETWRGTVTATPPAATFHPTLKPVQPPTVDDAQVVVSIALYRAEQGAWALRVRGTQSTGRRVQLDEALGADPEHETRALVLEALGIDQRPPVAAAVSAPVAPKKKPLVKRWWLWTAVGAGAAALAIGLGVGLTRDHDSHGGTAGGPIGAL